MIKTDYTTYTTLEEGNALKTRIRALKAGVIPAAGTSWKKALKKIEKNPLKHAAENAKIKNVISAYKNMVQSNKIDPHLEIAGFFGKKNFPKVTAIGDENGVTPNLSGIYNRQNRGIFHTHPAEAINLKRTIPGITERMNTTKYELAKDLKQPEDERKYNYFKERVTTRPKLRLQDLKNSVMHHHEMHPAYPSPEDIKANVTYLIRKPKEQFIKEYIPSITNEPTYSRSITRLKKTLLNPGRLKGEAKKYGMLPFTDVNLFTLDPKQAKKDFNLNGRPKSPRRNPDAAINNYILTKEFFNRF